MNSKQDILEHFGIFEFNRLDGSFIQYNDFIEHETFFQCPRCESLNNTKENIYGDNKPLVVTFVCKDCLYEYKVKGDSV